MKIVGLQILYRDLRRETVQPTQERQPGGVFLIKGLELLTSERNLSEDMPRFWLAGRCLVSQKKHMTGTLLIKSVRSYRTIQLDSPPSVMVASFNASSSRASLSHCSARTGSQNSHFEDSPCCISE